MEYNVTYRKKNNGWQFIISYKDENGKWKQRSKQGFNQKREAKPVAEEMLKKIERSLEHKEVILKDNYDSITFKQLSEAFLAHSRLYRERNTIKGYKSAINNFELINDMLVKDIKKIDIMKCLDEMTKNLKSISVKKYTSMIKLIFDYYIENYDPNYSTPIYNIKLSVDKTESTKKALTRAELKDLLKKIKDNKYYIVAFIAANTGLRLGEVLGLTWNDLDRKNMVLKVNKQYKVLNNGKSGLGSLKSKNSNREVPITVNFLKELDKYDKSNVRTLDNRIAPFGKTLIDRHLNPILRKLYGISIHELRHTYATLLIANGVDFKTAAKILGHTVEMTLKTYSHVNDEMMKKASERISEIF